MIRVVLYLLLLGLLAFCAVWLADRPGEVAITWLGHRVDTSVMVLLTAVLAAAALAIMLWSSLRALVRMPHNVATYMRNRRGAHGYLALSQGLIAVGSGDPVAARRFMEAANRALPEEPLTFLLRAQTAQLCGDRVAAVRNFELMAGRDDTKMLGLHGLFVEARRRNDPAAALFYAGEAAKHDSVPGWAGNAVLEFRCIAGDWSGALHRLERNMQGGLVDRVAYRRQRAVLLTAQAASLEGNDRTQASTLALEAVKLAPSFVPAAALAGRVLTEMGEPRKAARIIETAWRANPHPDLAEAYGHLRPGDSARERLGRIQTLTARTPGNSEAALAVARAALDAQEFAIARDALAPLLDAPSRRVAILMAQLERMQQGDEGRAREWMARALTARRDPAWTADGFISERWLPVSPITGRLDAFEWKDPLSGDEPARALIEAERSGGTLHENAQPSTTLGSAGAALSQAGSSPLVKRTETDAIETQRTGSSAERTEPSSDPLHKRDRPHPMLAPIPLAPGVIPLVHAPDDPGPEPEVPTDGESETSNGVRVDNWTRIRHLFRP
jgi:HemY protein